MRRYYCGCDSNMSCPCRCVQYIGPRGATGPAGAAGPQGATGATGATGPTGPAATVTAAAPVADATSAEDVVERFNELLANLRAAGLLATDNA